MFMKTRILPFFIAFLSFWALPAQNLDLVHIITQENISGNSRFEAMSGAFGALGGNLSAIHVNPAAGAVFNTNQFGLSSSTLSTDNITSYFGTSTPTENRNSGLNQIGGVLILKNNNKDLAWKKIVFGFNAQRQSSYNNTIQISGTNTANGLDTYFLDYAAGKDGGVLGLSDGETVREVYQFFGESAGYGFEYQQAFLGYQGYIFDYLEDDGLFVSNAIYSSVQHNHNIKTSGDKWDMAFTISGQYNDWLYLGVNMNISGVEYRQISSTTESGYDTDSPLREIYFQNELYTYGGGVSLQFGAIATPNKNIRLGASYKSPTWYSLNDEFSQFLETKSSDVEGNSFNDVLDLTNIVNVYEDYTIKTPSEFRGSLAYIFGQRGLISFDYVLKSYQNTHIGPNDNDVFNALNDQIDQGWISTSSFRIGGEYRQGGVSLRAGYHLDETPYNHTSLLGDRSGYSFGIGFNFKSSEINLSVLNSDQNRSHQLYDTGLIDRANNDINLQQFTVSWNFKF
jgi:hypothetical protein